MVSISACTEPASVGEVCINTADCGEGLRCIDHVGADPAKVCMTDCELATTRLCSTGELCTRVDADPAIGTCYLGGSTAIGEECVLNSDCVAGGVCVVLAGPPAEQRCFQACEVDVEGGCGAGETCLPLMSAGNDGYCTATP